MLSYIAKKQMKILYKVPSIYVVLVTTLVNLVAFLYASISICPVNFLRVLSSGSWCCRHFMMSERLLCLNVWLRPGFCAKTSSYIISRYTISQSEHPKPFPVLSCPRSFFYFHQRIRFAVRDRIYSL